jgi:hypothetical protein
MAQHGQARIDPDHPEALGICDRCGNLYNLRDLIPQYQWTGTTLQDLHLLVCDYCLDEPSEFLKTIILPPDPEPVYNVRVPNFALDEKNDYTLKSAGLGVSMFQVQSAMTATLTVA